MSFLDGYADLRAALLASATPGIRHVGLFSSGDAALEAALAAARAARDGGVWTAAPGEHSPSPGEVLDAAAPIAAAVAEPVMSIPAGLVPAAPGRLFQMAEACAARDVPLIADERWVAGGRMGTVWASARESVAPAAIVAGDSLGHGIGIVLATDRLAGAAGGDGGAHPDAAAHVLSLLRAAEGTDLLQRVRHASADLADLAVAASGAPGVREVRVRGLAAGFVAAGGPEAAAAAAAAVPRAGAIGDVVAYLPPLDVESTALEAAVRQIVAALGAA